MLTFEQLMDLEDRIQALIAELETTITEAGESTAAVAPDVAIGRISRIDSMQQQEMAKAGVRRNQMRIAALQEALNRMEGGTYGMCAKCNEDIDYARLEVAPEAKLCATCSAAP